MAWHDFQPGERYTRAYMVAACERRIRNGGVTSIEEKKQLLDQIQKHAPEILVWSPLSSGWGASPFNPNCWRTTEGNAIVPDNVAVTDLAEDGDA